MTQASKLKQIIRARARKTGESYTTARLHVVKAREKKGTPSKAEASRSSSPAKASRPSAIPHTRGGVSEASILKATGRSLEHWFAVLDAFGAAAKGHTASARHLGVDHGIPGWFAQGITVTYERAHGLRAMNQACSGDFQVSVSKTMAGSMEDVLGVLRNPRRRKAWLAAQQPDLGRALAAGVEKPRGKGLFLRPDGSAGLRFPWNGTAIEVRVTPKTRGGVTFVVAHTKLADSAQVEERRAQWKAALDALKLQLQS
jgi:hypothetical protein